MQIENILMIIQIIVSIALIGLVLIQQQDSGFYSSTTNINRSRRGTEKVVYNLTIFVGLLFVVLSIINTIYATNV